jgi:hypothetical protein
MTTKGKIRPCPLALREGVTIPGCPHNCDVAEYDLELLIFLLLPPSHAEFTGQASGSILDFVEGSIYFMYVHICVLHII